MDITATQREDVADRRDEAADRRDRTADERNHHAEVRGDARGAGAEGRTDAERDRVGSDGDCAVARNRNVGSGCDPAAMSSTTASRARADLLRERIATVRKGHARATALAQVQGTVPPPESHLAAFGVADHFPAMVASQEVNRHLLASLANLLTYIEREQGRVEQPHRGTV